MNLPTILILTILILLVVLDIRYLLHNGMDSCGGSCANCGHSCKWVGDIKKAQKKIERTKKLKKFFCL